MSQCKCDQCTFNSKDLAGYIRRLLGQEDELSPLYEIPIDKEEGIHED